MSLERMGALDRGKLAQVLKSQVVRKLTRLFFVVDGHLRHLRGAPRLR
jgi:hypothetical protein